MSWLQRLAEINEQEWRPVGTAAFVASTLGIALVVFLANTGQRWVFLLDNANLALHEAGHPIFGLLLGDRITVYGGTLAQLLFPVAAAATFWRRREALSFALCAIWLFENFWNIARYMADARAQVLPLVGSGEHDWTEIFSRWGVLGRDTGIAGFVTLLGWLGVLIAWSWLARRWWLDRELEPRGESRRNMVRGSFYFRLSNFYFWYFAFIGAFAPYFALYLKSLGFSASQIGVLLAVNPVARIFGPNFWGWLSDHSGARGQLIRLTAVGTAVTFVAVFFNRGIGWMFAALLVLNIFWCAVLPLAESATLNLLGSGVGTYGRIRLWGSVGFVAVVVAGGYLLDQFGIDALAPMVLTLLVLMAASTFPLPRDREPTHHGEHAPILRIVAQPAVIALFAGFFLMQVGHGPYNGFYSIHLVEAGYSKKAVGWLWAFGVLAEIALFLWLPRLMRAYSLNQILRLSFGCAFLRFLLIAWGIGSIPIMVLAQLMHAITFGAYHAAGVAAMHQIFRGRHQARGQALYTSLGYGLGGTLGTLGAGYAWESWGPQWTFTFAAVAALLALLVVWWKPMSFDKKAKD